MWGQGTEEPLCVSPDHVSEWLGYVARVTKINYSHWKIFLHFSPLLFFFLSLGEVQQHATPKGRWDLSLNSEGEVVPRYATPHHGRDTGQPLCFIMEHAFHLRVYVHQEQTTHPSDPPQKKDLELIPVLFHTTSRAGKIDSSRYRQAIFVFLGD